MMRLLSILFTLLLLYIGGVALAITVWASFIIWVVLDDTPKNERERREWKEKQANAERIAILKSLDSNGNVTAKTIISTEFNLEKKNG